MAYHDFQCSTCNAIFKSEPLRNEGGRCNQCKKGKLEILWTASTRRDAAVHSSERAVLYYSAKEKKFQYPGSNDRPVPERLQRRGYERVEMTSLRDLDKHAARTGAVSHVANFDRGTGRSLDGD